MTRDQEQLLDDLLTAESGLSGREVDFIENLDQNYRDRDMSPAQEEWLQAIGERAL